jgi:hypothetical protein
MREAGAHQRKNRKSMDQTASDVCHRRSSGRVKMVTDTAVRL